MPAAVTDDPTVFPAVTTPTGVEAPNAASVLAFVQLLANRTAYLRQNAGPSSFTFVGSPGNVAATTYFSWGGTSQAAVAANGTVRANGQTTHMAAIAGVLRALVIKTGTLTAGGTVTVTVMKNGVATAITATIAAATAAGTVVVDIAHSAAVAVGDTIEVQITNNAGVTTSIGLSLISVLMDLA